MKGMKGGFGRRAVGRRDERVACDEVERSCGKGEQQTRHAYFHHQKYLNPFDTLDLRSHE